MNSLLLRIDFPQNFFNGSFHIDDDYQEMEKIKEMLNPNEQVIMVARQSRLLPGGSYLTPNIIYATTKRLDANLASAIFQLFGKSDISAYLFMMAIRLIQLKRVLKSSGSIYLHCDPTASHLHVCFPDKSKWTE